MNNFISKTVQNPYQIIKNKCYHVYLHGKDYMMEMKLSGEFGNKKVYCIAGERKNTDNRNYFLLTKPEIDDLHNKLEQIILGKITKSHTEFCTQVLGYIEMEIVEDKVHILVGYKENKEYDITLIANISDLKLITKALESLSNDLITDYKLKDYENSLMDTLHDYIDKGYIQEIKLENLNKETIGFDPIVYKTFKITAVPIYDIPSDAGINLTFSFIRCLHLDINENKYNETLDYITNGNKNIKVTFINYDRKKEISNYITKAKKELSNYDLTKRRTPSKEDVKKVREIMNNLGMIKK